MAPLNQQLRIYDNLILVNQSGFTGSGAAPFHVLSGSRLLVVLRVDEIDAGASITVTVNNSIDKTSPVALGTFSANAVGPTRQIYTDFNNFFEIDYVVTGGNATFKIALALFDNAINTTIANADIHVNISDKIDSDGNYSSTRIGDGTNQLSINPDGTMPVEIEDPSNALVKSIWDQALQVISGSETNIVSYTVPAGKTSYLIRAEASGENIAKFSLYLNNDNLSTRRTNFGGDLTTDWDFTSGVNRPLKLNAGDVVLMTLLHMRPNPGDFEGRIQVMEIG